MQEKPLDHSELELLEVIRQLHAAEGPFRRETLTVIGRGRGMDVARPLIKMKALGLIEEFEKKPFFLARLFGAKPVLLMRPTEAALALGSPTAAEQASADSATSVAPAPATPPASTAAVAAPASAAPVTAAVTAPVTDAVASSPAAVPSRESTISGFASAAPAPLGEPQPESLPVSLPPIAESYDPQPAHLAPLGLDTALPELTVEPLSFTPAEDVVLPAADDAVQDEPKVEAAVEAPAPDAAPVAAPAPKAPVIETATETAAIARVAESLVTPASAAVDAPLTAPLGAPDSTPDIAADEDARQDSGEALTELQTGAQAAVEAAQPSQAADPADAQKAEIPAKSAILAETTTAATKPAAKPAARPPIGFTEEMGGQPDAVAKPAFTQLSFEMLDDLREMLSVLGLELTIAGESLISERMAKGRSAGDAVLQVAVFAFAHAARFDMETEQPADPAELIDYANAVLREMEKLRDAGEIDADRYTADAATILTLANSAQDRGPLLAELFNDPIGGAAPPALLPEELRGIPEFEDDGPSY